MASRTLPIVVEIAVDEEHPERCGDDCVPLLIDADGNYFCGASNTMLHYTVGDSRDEVWRCPECLAAERKAVADG